MTLPHNDNKLNNKANRAAVVLCKKMRSTTNNPFGLQQGNIEKL